MQGKNIAAGRFSVDTLGEDSTGFTESMRRVRSKARAGVLIRTIDRTWARLVGADGRKGFETHRHHLRAIRNHAPIDPTAFDYVTSAVAKAHDLWEEKFFGKAA